MSTMPTKKNIFDDFDNYEKYAWRQETLDVFNVGSGEDENVLNWLAGTYQPQTPETSEWARMTTTNRQQGRPVSRVRLIGHPITLYTAWEHSAYRGNIASGEEVRILDRNMIADDLNPLWNVDFWLFDDKYVWIMHYDRTGALHHCTVSHDVEKFVEQRKRALELSVAYEDYSLPAW